MFIIETPRTRTFFPRADTLKEACMIAYGECVALKKNICIWNDDTGKLSGIVMREGNQILFMKMIRNREHPHILMSDGSLQAFT